MNQGGAMSRYGAVVLLGVVFAGGCGLLDPVVCPGVVSRAIEVEVRDARTGAPAAAGALGIAREGSFADTLRVVGWMTHPDPETAHLLGGAEERPGLYAVRVEKPGYLPWERSGVRAQRGPCGVVTARLQANLEPLDP
jgi:hypothetical protein